MSRNERRQRTMAKLKERVHLMTELGMQGGLLYHRHRIKIQSSAGYMRTGNVSHYVRVKKSPKTRSRTRYGAVFTPAKRDAAKIESMVAQLSDERNDNNE